MSGLSMGGVHACMAAAVYPQPVACVPLLAPRSAAVAYCHGALAAAMAWEPLLRDAAEKGRGLHQVGWGGGDGGAALPLSPSLLLLLSQ